MEKLTQQKCLPCEGIGKAMTPDQYAQYLDQVKDWRVIDEKKIQRDFTFKDFAAALAFTNKVGEIAEGEGHHPDIFLHDWNKIQITSWTHALSGLTMNDFILASKIDAIRL